MVFRKQEAATLKLSFEIAEIYRALSRKLKYDAHFIMDITALHRAHNNIYVL